MLPVSLYGKRKKMVTSCCVVGCTNRFQKGGKIKLFRFPRGKRQRRAWIRALKRTDFEPKDHSRVCSVHFVSGFPEMFDPHDVDFAPSLFFQKQKILTHSEQMRRDRSNRKKIVTTFETAARIQEEFLKNQLNASISFHRYCQLQDESQETATVILDQQSNTDVSFEAGIIQCNGKQTLNKKTGILTATNINMEKRIGMERTCSLKAEVKQVKEIPFEDDIT